MTTRMERAEDEIARYEEAMTAYRVAVAAEAEHESRRAVVKLEAIRELVQQENPATPGKTFSFTAAESFVGTHEAYAAHLAQGRRLVDVKLQAEAALKAASLTAQLAVTAMGVES